MGKHGFMKGHDMKLKSMCFFAIEYVLQYVLFVLLIIIFELLSEFPVLKFILGLGSLRGLIEITWASGTITYLCITGINSKSGDMGVQSGILLLLGVIGIIRNLIYIIVNIIYGGNLGTNIVFVIISIAYIIKSKSQPTN